MGKAIIIGGISFASKNLGVVTPTQHTPLTALTIVSPSSIVGEQYMLGLEFNPADTDERSVTWSIISGGAYASVNQYGLLTIVAGTSGASVTIKAVSNDRPSVSTTKTVTVSSSATDLWTEANADSDFGQYMSGLTKKYELSTPRTYNGQQTSGDAITQPLTGLNNYVILFEATFGTNPVSESLAPCVYSRVSDNANFSKASDRSEASWAADTKYLSNGPIYPGVVDGNRYKILIFFNRSTGMEYVKNLTTGQMYSGSGFVGGGTLREEFYLGGGASDVNNFTGTIHQFYIGE